MDSHNVLGGSKGGGYSKAQMCLQKILSIICSVPPHQPISTAKPPSPHQNLLQQIGFSSSSSSQDTAQSFGRRGFLIDLNLELTSSPETETNSQLDQDDSSSQEKKGNLVSETDFEDDQKRETEPFFPREEKEEEEEDGASALLIETGKELSSANGGLERDELCGGLGTQKINDKESVKKRRENRRAYLYRRVDGDVSQVVRTKRGRLRVLPCRYRDSVLQPLARNANPRKRQRLK